MFAMFRRKPDPAVAKLYEAMVAASRQPVFYAQGQVPDSIDGRFDLMLLHAFLLFYRLRSQHGALAQQVFDMMFAHLDLSLREIGVGDTGVSKRIKHMGQSFYGRMAAYESALSDDVKLKAALSYNLFGTLENEPDNRVMQAFVRYVRASLNAMAQQPDDDIRHGFIKFADFEVHDEKEHSA